LKPESKRRNQTGWNGNEQRGYISGPQNHMSKYLGSEDAKAAENRNRRDVWTVATQSYSGAHFATWPEKLVEPMILAGSKRGDIVLDPFSGSGTTGRVAFKHGRRYIGLDLNPEYMTLAEERTAIIQMAGL